MTDNTEFLNDSILFDVHLTSHYQGLQAATDMLLREFQPGYTGKHPLRPALNTILCNLALGAAMGKPVAISRRRGDYERGRYSSLFMRYQPTMHLRWNLA